MERNSKIISRLTALWALSEAGLGGIMHALQSPFTGLFVGGFAILLVTLIAYFSDNRWKTIIRSLLIVMIIKLAVSPHSPPTAYLAVSFQAIMAGFIYSKLRINMWSSMLLGIVTLVESAIQKLLVLWLIYGSSLWSAIDEFGDYIAVKMSFMAGLVSSQVLISVYLWIYALIGILLGYLIYDMILYLEYNKGNVQYQIKAIEFDLEYKVAKKKRVNWRLWLMWAGVLLLILAYYFFTQQGAGVWKNGLYIVIRSLGILLVWYYLLGPLVTKWLRKFLATKQSKVQREVDETLTLLPFLKNVIELAWKENRKEKGYTRWKSFMGDAILYSIHLQLE